MMDSKKGPFAGLFPEDLSTTDTDVASSSRCCRYSHNINENHLRTLSPAPTAKFSLRRSSIATSASSSSTYRLKSELKSFLSCVTSQTLPDECARYRFIAWVAAKRSECQHMSEVDKLECPLLRCRKRFPAYEELVKHIFDCEHLASGEYWCFEHLRAERFDDGKCKGCCGHPTRRRKILSMASSFFSNLGRKSKSKRELAAGNHNDSVFLCPPPSYESLQQELSATNEIYELPSPEPVLADTVSPHDLAPQVASRDPFVQPPHILPASDQAPIVEAEEDEREASSPFRPSLQLNTLVETKKHIRAPLAPRFKHLSPSCSVRSTTSTISTTSTTSATSTVSRASSQSLVSPVSVWSEASNNPFSMTRGFKPTSFTSPSHSGTLSPGEVVTEAMITDRDEVPLSDFSTDLVDYSDPSIPPRELPGTLPVDANQGLPDPVGINFSAFGLENYDTPPVASSSTANTNLQVSSPRLGHMVNAPPALADVPEEFFSCSNAKTLVEIVWATLGETLNQCQKKLDQVESNPLADALKALRGHEVAQRGLDALELIFRTGQSPVNAINCLCLIHLAYAFSVPIFEKHAMARYKTMFFQALRYIQGLPEENRGHFKEVVSVLWQPLDLTDGEVERFLGMPQVKSVSDLSSLKGKQREQPVGLHGAELNRLPLVAVAQEFLDELESAIVFNSAGQASARIATSALIDAHDQAHAYGSRCQQSRQQNYQHGPSPLFEAISLVVRYYKTCLSNVDGFHDNLDDICQRVGSGRLCSARKAELEVLRAGKSCLDSSLFFDSFAPKVRKDANLFYSQVPDNPFTRAAFHLHAITVVRSMMSGHHDILPADMPTNFDELLHDFLTENVETLQQQAHSNDVSTLGSEAQHSLVTQLASGPPRLMVPAPTLSQAQLSSSQLDVPPPHPSLPSPTSSLITPAVTATSPGFPTTAAGINAFLCATSGPTPVPLADSPTFNQPVQSLGKVQLPTQLQHDINPPGSGPSSASSKVESSKMCEICGYRPKGDPRWFQGSMAKHKKTMHSAGPDKVYYCPYPGCQSAYKNREDNLKQHMKDKGHYVDDRRPQKRKKV